ncbi:MAG: hypothetical protein ACN6RG_08170 [Stenotrophomonas sp.]
MKSTIECQAHGEQEQTFVCCHLASALSTGENVGFFWAGEPRGDAWCSSCEDVRIAEGGVSRDWNDRSEMFGNIQLLCGACYDRIRAQHGL